MGSSSVTGDEVILFSDNMSFDGTPRSGKMTTDGQLWIGHTSSDRPNNGGHVKLGTLTSPDNSITFSYSSPNITAVVAGGSTVGKTITGNTGGALNPTGGNWNILGLNSAITGYSPYVTGSVSTETINMPGTVKWVVNATSGLGTHTTIQAAVTAASAGDDVFITAKATAYTEDVALKAGVNLIAYGADSSLNATGTVQITGKLSFSSAGTVSISGIQLNTNSDNFLAVTGSAASIVNLNNCYLNCLNNTGISFTTSNTSAKIWLNNCFGNLGTTGIKIFDTSSTGQMNFRFCNFTNTGLSLTDSTISAGNVDIENCVFASAITTSSSGTISGGFNTINLSTNTTALTIGGGTSGITYSYISSGTASAISISSTLNLFNCLVGSTNTNCITGAGAISYGNLTLTNSKKINTTTQTIGAAAWGLTQGTAPTAGAIGEQIRSFIPAASEVSLTTNTPANLTSISLTAGIWDVSCLGSFDVATSTSVTNLALGISTTSATLSTALGDDTANMYGVGGVAFVGITQALAVPSFRITLSATTTVYCVARAIFTVSTCKVFGRISATRVG